MKKYIIAAMITLNIAFAPPIQAQTNSNSLVKGLNAFALDMYQKISVPNDNVIFSPYSLSSLMTLLISGSAGSTQQQLIDVLHLNQTQDSKDLSHQLDQLNLSLTALLTGNAFWADQALTYKPDFLAMMQQNKSISFFRVDFAHAPNLAVQKINSWIADKTNGYIKQLFNALPPATKLVLTNAIYFKGLWEKPFTNAKTQLKTFTTSSGNHTNVSMMQQQSKFAYTENDLLQLVRLRYSGNSLEMVILLPKSQHTLSEIQKSLPATLQQLMNSAYDTEVILNMPKFKLESTFDSLSQTLQGMGLTAAFGPTADFSPITDDSISISAIIQKAIIQVDEKGTVAAAATGMVFATAMARPMPPIVFNADHPFLYFIHDTKSDLILFMGQVVNPH